MIGCILLRLLCCSDYRLLSSTIIRLLRGNMPEMMSGAKFEIM